MIFIQIPCGFEAELIRFGDAGGARGQDVAGSAFDTELLKLGKTLKVIKSRMMMIFIVIEKLDGVWSRIFPCEKAVFGCF